MKICPVGAELLRGDRRTDGRTDMTMLIVAFLNSGNAPKIAINKLKKSLEKIDIFL